MKEYFPLVFEKQHNNARGHLIWRLCAYNILTFVFLFGGKHLCLPEPWEAGLWSRDPWSSWLHHIHLGSSLLMFLEITRFNSTHIILLSSDTSWDLSPVEYVVVNWSMGLEITRPWWSTWKPLSTEMPFCRYLFT